MVQWEQRRKSNQIKKKYSTNQKTPVKMLKNVTYEQEPNKNL